MGRLQGIVIGSTAVLCCCLSGEKSVRSNSSLQVDTAKTPDCAVDAAPTFGRFLVNEDALCEAGVAHIVIEAIDTDSVVLEYGVSGEGLVVTSDGESPRGFLLSEINPHRAYALTARVGDGCTVTEARVVVGGPSACTGTPPVVEKAENKVDDFYKPVSWELVRETRLSRRF